jgi:DNA-directed RNA polymerase beta subunit
MYSNNSTEDNNIIDVIHANTAFTTSCNNTTEINLFREEEWFKVFIHETFHCLGLDFSHYNEIVNISKDRILSLFHINSDIKLYETYCEMGAELINILFYLFLMETKRKHKSISLENIIKNEQIFSIFQSCKVLSQLEMNYEDLFEDREHDNKYKENTNVFSYYIVKSILIFHLEDYIQFIINKNNKSFNIVNNKIKNDDIDNFKQQNINDFCDLIEKNYKNKNYLEWMNYMNEWLRIHKKSKKFSKSLEYNTLKMTILEIE